MPLFSVAELIDMSAKDEETGIAFYEALAERTRNPELKRRLLAIARQEESQLAWFQKMRDEIGHLPPAETYPGEYETYLRALLDSHAFPDPETAAANARAAGSDAEAMEMAIRLEKDTLLFLLEMRGFVGKQHGEHVEVIIEEERDHLVDLAELRKMAR